MKNPIITFAKLYAPIVIFFLMFSLIFFVLPDGDTTRISVAPFGFFTLSVPITNDWLLRSFLIICSFIPLASYLIYDFSSFFPDHFQIEIFFDDTGLEERLKILTSDERSKLRIAANYNEGRMRYYEMMDTSMASTFCDNSKFDPGDGFYAINTGWIRCEGHVKIKLRKIAGGLQHYRIDNANGELKQLLERPGKKDFSFESRFERYPSSADIIKGSLRDIYIHKEILLYPTFKQILSDRSDKRTIHHLVIAVTKVYFFPYPK